MLEIRTLGGLDVRRPDGETVAAVLEAPKRFALLSHLAVESPNGPRRRDALLALFWPEKDGRSARNALNVTLHEIRSALGSGAIVSHGAELVGIDPAAVRCDAADLTRALAEGRLEEALALYTGPFLPGFHLSDAPGFEKWLDAQRDRFRRGAVEAARALARQTGDERSEVAIRWLRRGLAIAPLDERLLQRLLETLDAAGDRAGAIRAYERFVERLDAEFGVEPSPETRDLADRILARNETNGDRREPDDVNSLPRPAPTSRQTARVTDRDAEREDSWQDGTRGRFWNPVATVVALLFLTAVVLLVSRIREGPAPAASRVADPMALNSRLFLVVPFETRGASPDLEYYGQGMVDLIAARLSADPVPRAYDPRETLRELANLERELGREPAIEDWLALAARFGAGGLVSGSVVGTPTALAVTARLVDVKTGAVRASTVIDTVVNGPGAWSPVALVDRLLAELLTLEAGEPPTRLAALSPSFEAVQEWLAGKRAYREGRVRAAHARYERALEHDSSFVLAALGLEETCQGWSGVPPCYQRAKRLGWRHADALNRIDRLYLRVVAGENLDEPDDMTRLEAAAAAHAAAPERVETRFEWADELLHVPARAPPVGDVATTWEIAAAELERVLAIDPGFEPALDHLIRLELGRGNWEAVDTLAAVYEERFPDADGAEAMSWWRAWVRRATIGRDSLLVLLDRMSPDALGRLFIPGVFVPGVDPAYLLRALDRRNLARGEPPSPSWSRYRIEMSLGRPSEARAYARGLWIEELALVESALYAIGDSSIAAGIVADLSATLSAPLPDTGDVREIRAYNRDVCIAEQWRLWHGQTSTAARSIRRLREVLPFDPEWHTIREAQECPLVLEAIRATVEGRADARSAVQRLETHRMRTDGGLHAYYVHMLLARLWEILGEPERALGAIRLRCRFCPGFRYPADDLRIEGRLAAKLGRTDEAIRAYEHYLSLRSDPEPSVRPQVDSVRVELRRLRAEASRQGRPPDSPPS